VSTGVLLDHKAEDGAYDDVVRGLTGWSWRPWVPSQGILCPDNLAFCYCCILCSIRAIWSDLCFGQILLQAVRKVDLRELGLEAGRLAK
jgi:hypothetical protein